MSDKKYYLVCDDDCRYEGMTKEQIIAAITEATGVTPSGADDGFITKIKESNANKSLSFWLGTETEFNTLGVSANCIRVKVDENGKVYLSHGGQLYADDIADGAVSTEKKAVIPSTGWTDRGSYNERTITVDGIRTNDKLIVDISFAGVSDAEQIEAINEAMGNVFYMGCEADNVLTVKALEIPDVNVPIKILRVTK